MLDTIANRTSLHIERDSRKDEAVVFIFIVATGGLLTWALLKPWIERYIEVRNTVQGYPEKGRKAEADWRYWIDLHHILSFWVLPGDWELVANVIDFNNRLLENAGHMCLSGNLRIKFGVEKLAQKSN